MLDQVVTMIGGLSDPLDADFVEAATEALFRLGADAGPPDWLSAGCACDLHFSELNSDQAEAAIRQLVDGRSIDIIAQSAKDRRKRLLFADMESTLIRNEMVDELAEMAGCGAEVAEVTQRAMNGEIDFEQALKARVRLLAGLTKIQLDVAARRIELMPGAATLVATMRRAGAVTVLISGGFHYFADGVGRQLGIDRVYANILQLADGVLSGTVGHPVMGKEGKYEKLIECAADLKLPLSFTVAVGDGANDLRMIEAAGLGVAYHAKPFVRERARWRIDHTDLTSLLFAQGYRAEDFVTSV